jgi:hypothetical protein
VQDIKAEPKPTKPATSSQAVQTLPSGSEGPKLSSSQLATYMVNPKREPAKLTQQTIRPIQIHPNTLNRTAPKAPQTEMIEARNTLREIKEDELREREKRIEGLKETNGKLALRLILTSVELLRKNSLPPPEPQIVYRTGDTILPILTSEVLPKIYIQPKSKPKKPNYSAIAVQTDPILSKQEIVVSKDDSGDISQLRKENQELRDIIVNRIRTSGNPQQSHDLTGLRAEVARLKHQVEEYEANASKLAPVEVSHHEDRELRRKLDETRDELRRVKEYWNRDKTVIRDISIELDRAVDENENLKVLHVSQQKIHDAERAELLSKIAKRDIARKELEQIISELERLKREKEQADATRSRQNEDLIITNQKLRQELQTARDEVEAMRKVFAEEQKKKHQVPIKAANTPKKSNKVSSFDLWERSEGAGQSSPPVGQLLFEKMLLGIEVCRLNFAYCGCNCGRVERPLQEVKEKDPIDDSPFLYKREDRDNTAKKVLQPISAASVSEEKNQIAGLKKERDSLKVILSDYQRKLLEARRTIDSLRADKGERENVPVRNGSEEQASGTCGDETCKSKKALRELELKNRILAAENAKLSSLIGPSKAGRSSQPR